MKERERGHFPQECACGRLFAAAFAARAQNIDAVRVANATGVSLTTLLGATLIYWSFCLVLTGR
jgi:hypothetical protein